MSDSPDLNAYIEFQSRTFVAADGSVASGLTLVVGDKPTFSVWSLENTADGILPKELFVRSIAASIGPVNAPPIEGTVTLTVAGVDSAAINFNAAPADVLTALVGTIATSVVAGLTTGNPPATVPSNWLIKTSVAATAGAPTVTLKHNYLRPECFGNIYLFKAEGFWWIELYLVQTPAAFTNAFEMVLAEPPAIARVIAGSASVDDDTTDTNEVQKLKLPVEFVGTYYITFGFRTTRMLGIGDGIAAIQSALEAMYTDGLGPHFAVTNPENEYAYIEFIGILGDAPQVLMTATPVTFTQGAITFTLDLSLEPMRVFMRGLLSKTAVPFELVLELNESQADLTDGSIPGRLMRFQQQIVLSQEQVTEQMAIVQSPDWLVPRAQITYIPYTLDQIITGIQTYVTVVGDGVHGSFGLVHNLGTQNLHVTLRENISGGRILTQNADFTASFDTGSPNNILVISFSGIPSNARYVASITTAGPISAFQAHTHTIGQIVGLQDALNTLGAAIAAILDRLPFTNPTLPADAAGAVALTFPIPDYYEIYPAHLPKGFDPKVGVAPKHVGYFFPAVNSTTIVNLTDPLPAVTTVALYKNNLDHAMIIGGAGGMLTFTVPINGFVASDGRGFYAVEKAAGKDTYYPTGMDRTHFRQFWNTNIFPVGKTLEIDFTEDLQTLEATSDVQVRLVVDCGDVEAVTTPGTPAPNFKDVLWKTTPMIDMVINVGPISIGGDFGIAIAAKIDNTLSGNVKLYGNWIAAPSGSLPSTRNFATRCRIMGFDTADDRPLAKGCLFASMTKASATIQ